MAESVIKNPNLTITSGSVSFVIRSYYAFRQGKRIHAEVYGDMKQDRTDGDSFPYFKINGTKLPSAEIKIGTMMLMDSNANPIYVIPGLAFLKTDGYVTQKASKNLTTNQRLGFIIDYVEE